MPVAILIVITGVCSVLLYFVLILKIRRHHRYLMDLPSAEIIQNKLKTGFRGFIFCLDVVGYPQCAKWIEPLQQLIKEQGLELLIFDGQIIFTERMEIAQMLKIEKYPCILAVNTYDQYKEQMFIYQMHIDQDITAIQHFISNKLGVIAS
ncbi:hypothetical protein MKY92_15110 [Paenibacillus sp. FSL R5-0623]|uniref:hypothetical protein n=1 Tax=Paenibacillus sp. FSL R5-0623 TaxID=2921651 RepID=UPI0030D8A579